MNETAYTMKIRATRHHNLHLTRLLNKGYNGTTEYQHYIPLVGPANMGPIRSI